MEGPVESKRARCRRRNASLANVIDVGIAYQEMAGYPNAKFYLLEHGVRTDIIRRVLTAPEQRRNP
jgi:hypothetical protein